MNGNEVTTTTRKGITGTGIKIIALVTMLIDHFASFILENYLATIDPAYGNVSSSNAADSGLNFDDGSLQLFILITFLHLIGRFAFTLFIFLVVEGFTHTRSVYRYALNMFIFALVSQLPYNLVHGGLLRFEVDIGTAPCQLL